MDDRLGVAGRTAAILIALLATLLLAGGAFLYVDERAHDRAAVADRAGALASAIAASLEIAGPGFVNLRLRPEVWLAGLAGV
ncbi:MAG TPA: hypothetical protein VFM45_04325, partial [Anaeromyxobacteraceae bacterium]|nr:hypothetical protein [Anaeromyxobacteraceae bacterium]